MFDIAGAFGCIFRFDVFADDLVDHVDYSIYCDHFAACYVDYLASGVLCSRCDQICVYYVVNICEIATLQPIAIDCRRSIFEDRDHKCRYRGGILACRILIRAKDVEISQADRLQAIDAVENLTVIFTDKFGNRIRGQRICCHCFHFRKGRTISVSRGTCRINESLDPGVTSGQQQGECRINATDVCSGRVVDTQRYGRDGALMQHHINTIHCTASHSLIAHVGFDEFDLVDYVGEIALPAGAEIVEYTNPPAFANKSSAYIGTDKGLVKYSGKKLEKVELPEEVNEAVVTGIGASSSVNAWAVLNGELYRFDGKKWSNSHYYTALIDDTFESIAEKGTS